jgi:hypothetical protein
MKPLMKADSHVVPLLLYNFINLQSYYYYYLLNTIINTLSTLLHAACVFGQLPTTNGCQALRQSMSKNKSYDPCDQIGPIFAYWMIVCVGYFMREITEGVQILWQFFTTVKVA